MKNVTYTRTGDEGTTSLIGGKRVPKYDERVETYGSVDELSAFVGVLRDLDGVSNDVKEVLDLIQGKLFTLESHFALDYESDLTKMIPALTDADVAFIEGEIDKMNAWLPELKAFVIPGGCLKASYCHVCRTVCRRAERQAWRMAEQFAVKEIDLRYLNRLSDYFFVLSRCFDVSEKGHESYWESVK